MPAHTQNDLRRTLTIPLRALASQEENTGKDSYFIQNSLILYFVTLFLYGLFSIRTRLIRIKNQMPILSMVPLK